MDNFSASTQKWCFHRVCFPLPNHFRNHTCFVFEFLSYISICLSRSKFPTIHPTKMFTKWFAGNVFSRLNTHTHKSVRRRSGFITMIDHSMPFNSMEFFQSLYSQSSDGAKRCVLKILQAVCVSSRSAFVAGAFYGVWPLAGYRTVFYAQTKSLSGWSLFNFLMRIKWQISCGWCLFAAKLCALIIIHKWTRAYCVGDVRVKYDSSLHRTLDFIHSTSLQFILMRCILRCILRPISLFSFLSSAGGHFYGSQCSILVRQLMNRTWYILHAACSAKTSRHIYICFCGFTPVTVAVAIVFLCTAADRNFTDMQRHPFDPSKSSSSNSSTKFTPIKHRNCIVMCGRTKTKDSFVKLISLRPISEHITSYYLIIH